MYADVNYWSVVLYVPDRSPSNLAILRRLFKTMQDQYVSVGGAGFENSTPFTEEEKGRMEPHIARIFSRTEEEKIQEPYIWFPHCTEAEAREFLSWADIDSDCIIFRKVS